MCKRIPSRAWVAMMIFWGTFVNYMFRSHYQISLLAMMAPRNNETVGDFGPRFDWSYEWEQQSISALFYGLTLISLPAGFIISWFGPWHVLFWSTLIMAISSDIVVPMAKFVGPGAVFTMRFIVGMMVGLQYPAMQNLASNWAPPKEKGKFMSCLMGNAFGSIITMPLTSLIIEQLGWSWSFYYLTLIAALFCIALYLLVADHPREYRWIRQEELEMIEESHLGTVNTSSKKENLLGLLSSNTKICPTKAMSLISGNPPYLKMLVSRPFWAVIVAQFGNQYNLFLALTTAPQYLKRRLKFNLKASAGIAALPHVARLLFGFTYGFINDLLLKKGVPKATCRRVFTIFSHILTGSSLCLFLAIGDCAACAVLLLVVMMVFNGAAVASVLINPQDLTPNWSGTTYSIMNFFGSWGGFIGPTLVSELTQENTIGEWAVVFSIGGIIGILTGIFFIFFGEFEIQPWNEPKQQAEETVINK
ncbi:hypothetical protein WA026_000319 [Henosepilachna vigintioctopunctata]|uniref:Major facilitator superfamily (MFS) profile domain-containing protein n=1 Tax=Henosepilachna vigintioctopunctata TaxID=420089 RepID=A0AAW1UX93_9CUCU